MPPTTEFDHEKLIPTVPLYFAIITNFNQLEFNRIFRNLGISKESLATHNFQDEVRELIQMMYRRRRLPELVDICKQEKPSCNWQEQSVPFFDAKNFDSYDDINSLTNLLPHISVSELHQLCFFTGVEFESFSGYLLNDTQSKLYEYDRKILERQDVDYEKMSIQEIRALLKEEWCNGFLGFWQRQGRSLTEIANVLFYLQPEMFE